MAERVALSAELSACRAAAKGIAKRHQKGASVALYHVLVQTMMLCERCDRDPAERTELDHLIRAGEGRRYIEKTSDVYVLVCRFVFADTSRANASRYAQSLREAARRQITSATLFDALKEGGGINALFLARPRDALAVETRMIRLDRPVRFSRFDPVTLRIAMQSDGVFKVLEAA